MKKKLTFNDVLIHEEENKYFCGHLYKMHKVVYKYSPFWM